MGWCSKRVSSGWLGACILLTRPAAMRLMCRSPASFAPASSDAAARAAGRAFADRLRRRRQRAGERDAAQAGHRRVRGEGARTADSGQKRSPEGDGTAGRAGDREGQRGRAVRGACARAEGEPAMPHAAAAAHYLLIPCMVFALSFWVCGGNCMLNLACGVTSDFCGWPLFDVGLRRLAVRQFFYLLARSVIEAPFLH